MKRVKAEQKQKGLVLQRKLGQSLLYIVDGKIVEVQVSAISGSYVKLTSICGDDITVIRKEILTRGSKCKEAKK